MRLILTTYKKNYFSSPLIVMNDGNKNNYHTKNIYTIIKIFYSIRWNSLNTIIAKYNKMVMF